MENMSIQISIELEQYLCNILLNRYLSKGFPLDTAFEWAVEDNLHKIALCGIRYSAETEENMRKAGIDFGDDDNQE